MANLSKKNYYTYVSAFGSFSVAGCGGAVSAVTLGMPESLPQEALAGATLSPSLATNACANELLRYFAGKLHYFNVAWDVDWASDFQVLVWRSVARVPYGQTASAADIARDIGRPGAHRVVGLAINACPLAIIIPTHRVISDSGYYDKSSSRAQIDAALRNLEARHKF